MKMLFRLLWLIVSQSRRSYIPVMSSCKTVFHVWPNDLDIFMHVNNGVYLTYADLARTDLMMRSGTESKIKAEGWFPVVAAETIRFRKSLRLGQRFIITTRIVSWSDRAIYLEHEYWSNGQSVATALIDARFIARNGERVDTETVRRTAGIVDASPVLPAHVSQWVDTLKSMDNLNSTAIRQGTVVSQGKNAA